uniref:DUF155 domain-containing protein n=1 Tax=Daucus carota subsp. sativus TaxID=79200 RepID=A0A166DSZ9_DAUCS
MATALPSQLKSLRRLSLSSPSLIRSLFTLSKPTGPFFRPPTTPSPFLSLPINHCSFSLFIPKFRAVIVTDAGCYCSLVRFMSSVPETVESNDGGVVEEDAQPSIPVRAYFFSTSVDLKRLVEVNKKNFIPPTSRMTNYVVLRFGDLKSELKGSDSSLCGRDCCYIVVFQYGSIVLFNVPDNKIDGYLNLVKTHASGILPEMRKDEYEVREKPTLDTWMQGGLDFIMLQYLNIDGIRTVGSVLGQSIALDYYVDGMVDEFTGINRDMEKSGTFKMEKKKLFQLVGKANSNLADVILKLGLFERSDIAWKDAKYAEIWEYLRDEFELTQRFASLDFKLKFVEHNIRFLQESLQNRKSDSLEWLIIVLIAVEIVISIYDIVQKSVL